MKTLFCLFVVVLLVTVPLYAQRPVQELPELQEWYSWNGAKNDYISYLPNFSQNGGTNAITQYREGEPTWYNQFAYDTTNRFQWKELGSHHVVQVDFNNDGISDYIDTRGRIYTSLKKGEIPMSEPVLTLSRGSFLWTSVGDFNADGYLDVFAPNSGNDFEIIFGNKELIKVKRTISSLPMAASATSLIGAYINEVGKGRFIAYSRNTTSEAFFLYGFTFEASPSDSVIISIKELDKMVESKKKPTDQIFAGGASSLYQNRKSKEYTLLVSYMTSDIRTIPLAIINDKFIPAPAMKISTAFKFCLSGSIDGDDEPDWVSMDIPQVIYSGNPAVNGTPRAIIRVNDCNIDGSYTYIGDVTGDSIGDIALGNLYCFRIYKGVDWRKLSVIEESTKPDFTVHQSEPNPINAANTAILPITLSRSSSYTLEIFDLTGKRIGELFKGELLSGEVRLPLDMKSLNLSPGMFTLRLSDGKNTRERAIVIIR